MNMMIERVSPEMYRLSFPETNRLNVLMVKEIQDEIARLKLMPAHKLIIDLEGIQFIDTAGFEFLLSAMHDSGNDYYSVEIVNISPEVAELITLLNLEEILSEKKKMVS